MDRTRVAVVDAFAREPLTGNAAGIVPEAGSLAPEQCQAIAREVNASETVFVMNTSGETRRVRYYSPSAEVDICGHGTIALYAYLFSEGEITPGEYVTDTNAGELPIVVSDDGMIWIEYPTRSVSSNSVSTQEVSDAVGIEETALEKVDLPVTTATAGLEYLIVPVDLFASLINADPDFGQITNLAEKYGVVGIYAFTFDTLGPDSTLHGRMWAPSIGVSEDPVTGTASAAVISYLTHHNALDPDWSELVLEQGHSVNRPGFVHVRNNDGLSVGGTGIRSLSGTITIPSVDDEDDLIEA